MTREPAKARPTDVTVDISADTGSRHVTVRRGQDDYVIVVVSAHAPDSLIDAAAQFAKGADK